ncbi:hypothetical protein H4F46_05625 [Pectobacterium brasiliense]|uniref:hypothetical protein n=1 Tax=Pectobacterium brasiliense TaxID=180957 RepID=UPI001968CFBB|nr:hypothetical protein [Pectobacterium brasiliense]MBN3114380.1 hypothetical protein [Pectobacterium brasiliense]
MINKIFSIFIKILNYSLFFHTSYDENFDTIESEQSISFVNLRFSLINIPFGRKIYYFITYRKTSDNYFNRKDFNLIYLLDYDLKWGRKTANIIEGQVKDYVKNIYNQTIEKTKEQESFLKQRISESNESMSTIRNKITHYTTIMFAFASALTYLYTKTSISFCPSFVAFIYHYLLFIITVQVLNLALFLRKGMMINSFYQSSFKELRQSDYKHELTTSIYRDWLARNDDTRYFSGIVKNAEKYLYRSICIGLISFLVVNSFSNNNTHIKNDNILTIPDSHII